MCRAACTSASGCLEDEIHTLNRLEGVLPSPLFWFGFYQTEQPLQACRTEPTYIPHWLYEGSLKEGSIKDLSFILKMGPKKTQKMLRPKQAEPARPFLLRAQLPNQHTVNSHRMPDVHPWGWWLPAQNVSFVPGYHKYHRYLLLLWHVKGWETTESSVLLILGLRTINYELES